MEIVDYDPLHLDAVVAMCEAEGWVSFAADKERAGRAMTAPGVTALVAIGDEARAIGFAQAVGDGCFGGYLCMLLVAADVRGKGVGKALVERTMAASGVRRLDLLSSEGAKALYERFPHNHFPGFRLYPDASLRPPVPGD